MSKKSIICIMIGIIGFLIFPTTVRADEPKDLTIMTEIGFEGKANPANGFPVRVTIQNNSPRGISGELAFTVSPSYSLHAADILLEVNLQANSEESYTISIPGYDAYSRTGATPTTIRFYEQGWEHGQELEFEGNSFLSARGLSDRDFVIGLLSNESESVSALKNISSINGTRSEIVHVIPDMIPETGLGLNMLSMLVVSDFEMQTLTNEQQQVIDMWVHQGGTMLIAGDSNHLEKDTFFYHQMPIQDDLRQVEVDADFLTELTDSDFTNGTFDLLEGSPKDQSSVLLKTSNDQPVLVTQKAGKGEYAQLLLSPFSEPFIEWEGSSEAWTHFLQPIMTNNYPDSDVSLYENYQYSISYISNLFPSSVLPLILMVGIFGGYLILFPVMYVVLRKMDKREHAWWVLPSVSILLCLVIFLIGGKDRINASQLNENVVLKIDDNGKAYGIGAASFLNNVGGTYNLAFEGNQFMPFPISEDLSFNQTSEHGNMSVLYRMGQQQVTFQDRDFWTISNVAGPIYNIDTGTIESDLTYSENEIRGTVRNNTNYTIQSLYFLAGHEQVNLGTFEKGEEKEVTFSLSGKTLFSPTYVSTYTSDESLDEMVERGLFEASFSEDLFDKGFPAFAGVMDESILKASLNGQSGTQSIHNLLLQTAVVHSEQQGTLTLENRDLSPMGYSDKGDTYFEEEVAAGESQIYVENGNYEIGFNVPNDLIDGTFEISKMTISALSENETLFEIYNNDSGSFEEIAGIVELEQADSYIDEWGYIQVQIQKNDSKDMLDLPQIKVEGEFSND
ncbi:hypothetical protein [Alkalicoccobacillus murimartini]|uniref:DUF4350 domain-containing protein n=1 Tax=Alkalicoccobacillus murimartini TaxID=171685 RepID=A0ABT9YE58_9BACI|nr:hypothetical protein [Alkalicoccobacillus murimartini]MDQ0206120.1 hypothetical protein [Alkalicoccobacillus murimartini]